MIYFFLILRFTTNIIQENCSVMYVNKKNMNEKTAATGFATVIYIKK